MILGIPARERHKTFWVRQQNKIAHFPEGRKLPPSCLDICKSTVAEESPPCSTVLPYFSPSSSSLLPPPVGRQSSEREPRGTKLWPQAGAGQPTWGNKLKVTEDKNFQMMLLPTSRNSMWSRQLILLKSAGCLPLPSAGGLKGTHLMHQQFVWMGAASACLSALLSLRADL